MLETVNEFAEFGADDYSADYNEHQHRQHLKAADQRLQWHLARVGDTVQSVYDYAVPFKDCQPHYCAFGFETNPLRRAKREIRAQRLSAVVAHIETVALNMRNKDVTAVYDAYTDAVGRLYDITSELRSLGYVKPLVAGAGTMPVGRRGERGHMDSSINEYMALGTQDAAQAIEALSAYISGLETQAVECKGAIAAYRKLIGETYKVMYAPQLKAVARRTSAATSKRHRANMTEAQKEAQRKYKREYAARQRAKDKLTTKDTKELLSAVYGERELMAALVE